ncbi:hypothetical protein LTR95_006468 [Oleoguttula sp. CCFEE 5521]
MITHPYLAIACLSGVAAHRVSVTVDASKSLGPLPQTSRFFGCDEPNEATQLNGSALIKELGELGPSQTYFRTHNLLTTGDGSPRLKWGSTNAYTEDETGNPIYNWTIVDDIFDTYLERNVKPYAQIDFMPKALSTNPDPYEFYFDETLSYNVIFTGWSYPPKSYQKWAELVYQWVKHSVERYGAEEVNSWYWEVWNEPNIPYFNGTEHEFLTLHDYAVDAVRRALPTARIGGPEIAGGGTGASGDYLRQFLQHTVDGQNAATGQIGTELDFISFHAKGSPIYINASAATPGHLQMNVSAALQNARDAFNVIKEFPTLEHLPVIIGEDDPDGCAACASPAYGYRNGIVFPSYTAESFVRQLDLAAEYGIDLQGTLTWAFEYDGRKYFDGLRVLTTNGIDKPILNIFRMFGKMTGDRVKAQSSAQLALQDVVANSVQKATDVGVLASSDDGSGKVAVMIWHYHDDDLPKPDAQIEVDVHGLAKNCKSVKLTHYRIDDNHSNSYTTWLNMGSPQQPTTEQYETLRTAGQLQTVGRPKRVRVSGGKVQVSLTLPIHGTSLLVLER